MFVFLLPTELQLSFFCVELLVISQEKTIQQVEGFDKTTLRHTETAEKNPLPDKKGQSSVIEFHLFHLSSVFGSQCTTV